MVTEQKCVDYLINIRWSDGVTCPHCGHHRYYITSLDKRSITPKNTDCSKKTEFKCANNKCYKKFSVTTGTILHFRNIHLRPFFYLMYSSSINKINVSSVQQALNLGLTQKTCWFMMMKIRALCYQDKNLKLTGAIEVDETYLAKGKWRNRSHYTSGRKIPVLGLIQRGGGKIVVKVIPNKNKRTVQDIILKHVEVNSYLYTDTAACYLNLDSYYLHETVNHRAGEYARGNVNTNSIENFWSKIKKSIRSVHNGVSLEHLQMYCDEVAYRWNTKDMLPVERFNDLLKRAVSSMPVQHNGIKKKVLFNSKNKIRHLQPK